MHKIKEKLKEELKMLEKQIEKKDSLSSSDLEMIHKISDTIKNIDKIEMLEDGEGGYSERTRWTGDGRIYGESYNDEDMSYARGRGRNARRDSMGRYSREGNASYNDGQSYNNAYPYMGDGRSENRGYSRAEGKNKMIECLEDLAENADTKSREAIHRAIKQIENA